MKKTRCKFLRALSVAVPVFLISSHAFSFSQINSEFELVLPRQFQENFINQNWQSFAAKEFQGNWQFSDQVLQAQGIPVQIKGVTLKVRSTFAKPTLASEQGLVRLQSTDLQAQLGIAEISVDQVIEREVGGVVGRFRVQVRCVNAVMNLAPGQGQFAVVVSPQVGSSQVGAVVKDIDISWASGALQAGDLQCEGAQGFKDLILAEVNKISADSVAFVAPQKEVIKKYVQESLSKKEFDFSGSKKILVSRPDIQVEMAVTNYQDVAGVLKLKGALQIQFLRTAGNEVKSLSLLDSSESNSGAASIRLPKDFAKEVMQMAYEAGTWKHTVSSSKISGFQSLMNSRFMQFFVWPGLMSFSKSAKFQFDLYSNENPRLQGSGLTYSLDEALLALMKAPEEGQWVSFMNFKIPLRSKINLDVNGGQLKTQFTNVNLDLNYSWDSAYVRNHNISKRFAASTIRSKILGALANKEFTMKLPEVPLGAGVSLKINSVQVLGNKELLLNLQP